MKIALLTLSLIAWQPLLAGTSSSSSESSSCVDDSGNPKKGSNCVCYLKKALCGDGVNSCPEHVCEQVSCKSDADCSAMSGKCVEGYCKK